MVWKKARQKKVDKVLLEAKIRRLFFTLFMSRDDDKIELEGVVEQALPGGEFLLHLSTEGFEGHELRARLSGKMRMHYIRIVPGDKVKVQVSPSNLDLGLITFRQR